MASKRMFSKKIISSDKFLDLPHSAQTLYFHLAMNGDDDGFIDNPKSIMRICGCSQDDMECLTREGFICTFESGVVCVRHWGAHNTLKNDRYAETTCRAERAQLTVNDDKEYEFIDEENCDEAESVGIQNGNQTEPERNEVGTKLEPSWNQIGSKLEPERNQTGTRMEPNWNQNGTRMEPEWNQTGTKLEPQHNITKHNLTKHNITNTDNNKEKVISINNYNNKTYSAAIADIVRYLNEHAGTQYKETSKTTRNVIIARLNEGFSIDDFKTVIYKKCKEWCDTDMAKYLRPQTLFGTKFEAYLNQPIRDGTRKKDEKTEGWATWIENNSE